MRTLLPEELAEYADAYGLSAAVAQRDYVAVRVAYAIASDPEVGGNVALKGGFALRHGYGSPRTSKDIDGTIGTKRDALDPLRLQRTVRGQCADLSVRFHPRNPTVGVDQLDFGNVEYVGPNGQGRLTLEMSYREDLLLPARNLRIDAFGIPVFQVRALALDEMIAEKWRCLVQRSPRRPGDPYDLWYLWSVVRSRAPATAGDVVDAVRVKDLVPRKFVLDGGRTSLTNEIDKYQGVWEGARGDVLPLDAPRFGKVREAVLAASTVWTPWR